MKKIIYLSIVVLFSMYNSSLMAQDPGDSTDVYGCTDTSATNYNPLATIDNGYCIYYCDSTVAFFWPSFSSSNDSLIVIQYYAYSPAGVTSYLWDFGDGNTSEEQFPNHFYNESGTYTYCLTITAPGQDDNSICTSTYCDTLVVNDWMSLLVTNSILGCTDPGALNYNPLATIDDGSCTYNNDTSVVDIYGCMDPAALNYNFLATVDDGSCIYDGDTSGTGFIYGCMDPIATNYNPLATIDDGSCVYQNDTLSSCEAYFIVDEINEDEGYITVINLSTGVDLSYYWDFGDSTFSTEAYPTHIYENEGFYMVCLTVVGNSPIGGVCASTYCDTIGISFFQKSNGFALNIIPNGVTGIEEPMDEISEINLYPNPATERLTLSLTSVENELITMSIYDLSGRIVKTWNSSITSGNNTINIDIDELTPGLYHLELRNNDERKVKRFQIVR